MLHRAVVIAAGIGTFVLARDAVQAQRLERMKVQSRVKTRVIQEVEEQIRREQEREITRD